MISLVRGTIVERGAGTVVVDTGGVGYEVFVPASAQAIGAVGEAVSLRTYLDVREGALDLYGFVSHDELEVFKLLIGVNRVGPRLAMKVLSAMTPREVVRALVAQDTAPFEEVSGLGAETAKRLLLDLSKKVKKLQLSSGPTPTAEEAGSAVRGQAESALRNFGYRPIEIEKALDWALQSFGREPTLEELIKKSLSYFHKG